MALQVVDLNLLGGGMATMASGETPTKVLCLTEVVSLFEMKFAGRHAFCIFFLSKHAFCLYS